MNDNNSIPAIIKPENIREIVQAAPEAYEANRRSRDNCAAAGETILGAIGQQGMDEELDRRAASYIEKSRRTVKAMNDRRATVTRLFDRLRAAYTAMENEIDPSKAGTAGYRLQQMRNQYAAERRAEEEKRRAEELRRQQAEAAARKFRMDVEEDFRQKFRSLVNENINKINSIDSGMTPENFCTCATTLRAMKDSAYALTAWLEALHTSCVIPAGADVEAVEKETKEKLAAEFRMEYLAGVCDLADYVLDRLPSKRDELERIAAAETEEAARMKAELEARQREEAARMEQQRAEREAEEKRRTEMEKKQTEMDSLFNTAQVEMAPAAKVKVSKKIKLISNNGILSVIGLWWSREGCHMSTEELAKMFKKQITFCEKLADREGVEVTDPEVEYFEEVKAR